MTEEISNIEKQRLVAFDLIKELFEGKVDKGGHPYVDHPMRVFHAVQQEYFNKCSDLYSTLSLFYEKACIVALLHDVIEDTHITLQDLYDKNFDKEIVLAVDAISRRKEEQKYVDFIIRVSKNDLARLVKIYDLEDNMDIKRLSKFEDYEQKRLKKYWYSWKFLKREINEIKYKNTIDY